MSLADVLENTHQLVIKSVEDLPESEWEIPVADDEWSVKDVLAHLTAYELVLLDALKTLQGEQPTPYLFRYTAGREEFNTAGVEARRYQTAQQVLVEYQDAQLQTSALLSTIPVEVAERKGTMPWLNPERSMADLLNRLYQHAQRHCEQIARFRSRSGVSESGHM